MKLLDGQGIEERLEIGNGHVADLRDILPGHVNAQGLFLEAGIVAGRAGGIGAVLAEENPVMDLISLPLHPVEETFQTDKLLFPVDQDLLLIRAEIFKRLLNGNSVAAASLPEIVIKIFVGRGVPWGKGLLLQRLLSVRDDLLPVDPDDSSKSLTGRAGPDRAVKRKEEWFRLGITLAAAVAGETSIKRECLSLFPDPFKTAMVCRIGWWRSDESAKQRISGKSVNERAMIPASTSPLLT